MARNKLSDLNDHLFMALERLNDDDLTGDKLLEETKKSKSIVIISNQIINNAKVTIDALKLVSEGNLTFGEIPETLGIYKKLDR